MGYFVHLKPQIQLWTGIQTVQAVVIKATLLSLPPYIVVPWGLWLPIGGCGGWGSAPCGGQPGPDPPLLPAPAEEGEPDRRVPPAPGASTTSAGRSNRTRGSRWRRGRKQEIRNTSCCLFVKSEPQLKLWYTLQIPNNLLKSVALQQHLTRFKRM